MSKTTKAARTKGCVLSGASVLALMAALPITAFAAPAPTALPENGTVTQGNAQITANGSTLQITGTGNSLIDWKGGFNVGSAATVNFVGSAGGGTNSANFLNIDTSGTASQLDGTMNAQNAGVWIANQNGIVVGSTAVINAPNENVALIGGLVSNDSNFAQAGTFSYGANNQASPVTIDQGASINGGTVWVAGSGAINITSSDITGSDGVNVFGGAGALAFTLSGAQVKNDSYGGNVQTNSVWTQINLEQGSELTANKVQISNYGNIQGPGTITTNIAALSAAGDINNPNGGKSRDLDTFYANGLNIQPLTGSSVTVDLGESGTTHQMFNVFVHGNATFSSDVFVNNDQQWDSDNPMNDQYAPDFGSHLIAQASGNITLDNYNGQSAFYFPGLLVVMAGSNGNATFMNKFSITIAAPGGINNAVTLGGVGNPNSGYGLGVFLTAEKIGGANGASFNVNLNGSNSSWLNTYGTLTTRFSTSELRGNSNDVTQVGVNPIGIWHHNILYWWTPQS